MIRNHITKLPLYRRQRGGLWRGIGRKSRARRSLHTRCCCWFFYCYMSLPTLFQSVRKDGTHTQKKKNQLSRRAETRSRARLYTWGVSTLLPTSPGFQEGYVGETRVDGERRTRFKRRGKHATQRRAKIRFCPRKPTPLTTPSLFALTRVCAGLSVEKVPSFGRSP